MKKIARIIAGLIIYVSMNIGIADHLPISYNVGATVVFFVVIGLWWFLSRRRRTRCSYEQFNRR